MGFEFIQRDDPAEFASKFNMNQNPFWFLLRRLLIIIWILGVESCVCNFQLIISIKEHAESKTIGDTHHQLNAHEQSPSHQRYQEPCSWSDRRTPNLPFSWLASFSSLKLSQQQQHNTTQIASLKWGRVCYYPYDFEHLKKWYHQHI